MGSLLIEIGQCGCQVGMEVNQNLSVINNSYLKRSHTNILHTIMLDTQPKIIKPLIENRQKYKYLDPANLKFFQYGRANNWSYGYLDSKKYKPQEHTEQKLKFKKIFSKQKPFSVVEKYFKQNSSIIEFTLEKIRNQLEKTTTFMGINVICSLGGGTGSGLGTRIVEEINNNFNTRVICHSVLPNQSGQTPLQHYNCALSIASIYQNANAIFTYQNDKMVSLFSKQEEQVSLKTINRYIGNTISSILSLNDLPDYDRYYFDLIDECVKSPSLKFLEAYSSHDLEKDKSQWDDIMSNVFNQISNANRDDYWKGIERKQKTLHCQIVFKGDEQIQSTKYLKRLKTMLNPINDFAINQVNKKQQNECLIIANRTRIRRYLGDLIEKGQKKLSVGAYTWNYMVDIEPAFQTLHNIVESYEEFI